MRSGGSWIGFVERGRKCRLSLQRKATSDDKADRLCAMKRPRRELYLLAFFVIQLPLWLLRAVRRWRLEYAGSASDQPARPANQFTLRGLLGLTLGAALLLGTWQWLHGAGKVRLAGIRWSPMDDVESSLRIALAGLPIVPLAWILLASGRRPVLRSVLTVLTVAGIAGALFSLRYFDGYSEAAKHVACVEAGTLLSGLVNLAVVGTCGYRLNQICLEPHQDRLIVASR